MGLRLKFEQYQCLYEIHDCPSTLYFPQDLRVGHDPNVISKLDTQNSFPFWCILEYIWVSCMHITGLNSSFMLMMFIIIDFALFHKTWVKFTVLLGKEIHRVGS